MPDIAANVLDINCACIELEVLFDVERDSPTVIQALEAQCANIRALLTWLRQGVPINSDCSPGLRGRFYRLPNHYRSVCWPIRPGVPGGSDVLVFKGTEPLCADFESYLQWMMSHRMRASELPIGLYCPLVLRMPPGAVPLDECVREQSIGIEVQRRHLATYGSCAQLPLPLLTFQMRHKDVDQYLTTLHRYLPVAAIERIEWRVKAGLAIEVYYYPNAPLRVADLPDTGTLSGDLKMCDAELIVDRWAQLLARLLHLGYMPYAPWNRGLGACIDQGNACVDGGFADLLTLVPFDSIPDSRLFRWSLRASMEMLARTAALLCASFGLIPSQESDTGPDPAFETFVATRVWHWIQNECPSQMPVYKELARCFQIGSVKELVEAAQGPPLQRNEYRSSRS